MSIQIKKKFIKSQVIDGTKVLFLNEDSFKAMKSNGDIAELFKFSNGDKLVMLQMPQVSSDPVAAEDLARKAYVDSQISSEQAAREAAVSAEESRALAAEAALQAAIDAEVVARTADVDAEEARALAAEAAEQAAREAADTALQAALDLEIAGRIAGDNALGNDILAEQAARIAGDQSLQSQLDTSIAERIAIDEFLSAQDLTFLKLDGSRSMEGDLNMEKTSAGAGAGVVSSYSVYQKPGAAPVVWHVDVVLNDPTGIFQYGGDFWQGPNDGLPPDGTLPPSGSLSYGIPYTSGSGVAIYWAVPKQADGITSNFAAAVKIGTLDFSKTDSSAFAPEGGLGGSTKYKIVGLSEGTEEFDAVNKGQLDSQVSQLQEQIVDVNESLSDTSQALFDTINAETAAREAADAALQAAIDALDSGVSGDLAAEIARATAAEAALQSAIDAEVSRATAAEAVLQSAINTEKGRVDAILLASEADKDSFAEIVQLINSVDTENDSAFASYVLSNNAALAQEVLDRQAGDTALQAAVSAEQAAREAADSAEAAIRAAADAALDARLDVLETDPTTKTYVDQQISSVTSDITDLDGYAQDIRSDLDDLDGYAQEIRSDLDQEILDRVADVDAEEARAMAAEAALSASISSEAAARAAADLAEEAARIAGDAAEASARAAAISSEQAAREAADVALQSAIDAEEVRAMAAEASLQSKLDAEEAARAAADAALQSELDAEEAARAAQDLVLDSKIDTKFQESKDYTDQKVADLVASAPAVLDTLKELADALGGDANFATTVASQIANAADNLGDRFMYEQFVVDAGMISVGYMELGYKGFAASMVVSNGRLMMFEGEDYSVSVVGGKSRLTFMGSMLPGEVEALEIGDIIKVKYLKDVR